jgi:hypothetical protein
MASAAAARQGAAEQGDPEHDGGDSGGEHERQEYPVRLAPGRVDRAAALIEPASCWPTGDAPALGEPDAGDDRTMGAGVKCRIR